VLSKEIESPSRAVQTTSIHPASTSARILPRLSQVVQRGVSHGRSGHQAQARGEMVARPPSCRRASAVATTSPTVRRGFRLDQEFLRAPAPEPELKLDVGWIGVLEVCRAGVHRLGADTVLEFLRDQVARTPAPSGVREPPTARSFPLPDRSRLPAEHRFRLSAARPAAVTNVVGHANCLGSDLYWDSKARPRCKLSILSASGSGDLMQLPQRPASGALAKCARYRSKSVAPGTLGASRALLSISQKNLATAFP
jgi:hypothetical protein